jgi:hypothetical protein
MVDGTDNKRSAAVGRTARSISAQTLLRLKMATGLRNEPDLFDNLGLRGESASRK